MHWHSDQLALTEDVAAMKLMAGRSLRPRRRRKIVRPWGRLEDSLAPAAAILRALKPRQVADQIVAPHARLKEPKATQDGGSSASLRFFVVLMHLSGAVPRRVAGQVWPQPTAGGVGPSSATALRTVSLVRARPNGLCV